jgi:peptidoglycan/LPS O-acetylase OafA/YrhL
MQYRQELDGLRAIAVVAVILNHIESNLLPSGFLGVDIFFVISGYVITASLQRTKAESVQDFLLHFYSRRIKRLVPALLMLIALTSVALSMFDPAPQTQLKTGLLSVFGLSNIYLIKIQADYFGDSVDLNSFTHTWSLGVEEQFYLVFPILLWFMYAKNQKRGAGRLVVFLVISAVLSLAFFAVFYQYHRDVAYYSMPTRFWELAIGAITFFLMRRLDFGQSNRWRGAISAVALWALLVILCLPENLIVLNAVLIVISTAVLIFFTAPKTLPYKVLSLPLATYVGLISYSLYLWHWPVLTISRWTTGITWYTLPFQLVLIFALASASYRYVEGPLRRATWSKSRAATVGYGLAGSTAVACFTALLMFPLRGELFIGKQAELVAEGVESLVTPYSIEDVTGAWGGGRMCPFKQPGRCQKN